MTSQFIIEPPTTDSIQQLIRVWPFSGVANQTPLQGVANLWVFVIRKVDSETTRTRFCTRICVLYCLPMILTSTHIASTQFYLTHCATSKCVTSWLDISPRHRSWLAQFLSERCHSVAWHDLLGNGIQISSSKGVEGAI